MKNNLTRTVLIRETNIWLQAERIDRHGEDHKLTSGEDLFIRKKTYHRLLKYFEQQVNTIEFNEIKRVLSFVMFDKNENRGL